MAQNPFKHQFVEDYIEIIAGYREPNGKSNYSIFTVGESLISLARYDTKVVPSLAEQTLGGRGYTDRQAKLAADLVLKYERQLFKKGIDVTPVRIPEYRLPLRTLDRSTRVWIENDTIKLKFPYDVKLIEDVRAVSKESKGSIKFNREARYHEADLTEWNLNWIHAFALQNNFEIDRGVKDLMRLVLGVEKTPYKIELVYTNSGRLNITNAADNLLEYVEKNLGGFDLENVLRLSDYAPILGYTVHPDISNDVIRNFNTRFWSLCENRSLKVNKDPTDQLVKEIFNYAELTNRFPIFLYEPDLSNRLLHAFEPYVEDSMVKITGKETEIPEGTRLIYTTKVPKQEFSRIPLMISSAGMLFGGDRQIWLQNAEKIVYFTAEIYNKSKDKAVAQL